MNIISELVNLWYTIACNWLELLLITARMIGFWVILLSPVLVPYYIYLIFKSRKSTHP